MNTGAKVAIGIGAATILGAGAFYFVQAKAHFGQYILVTGSASEGGTIDPNAPSGIYKPAGSIVNIMIKADAGYTIGQVLEDGTPINQSTTDTQRTYTLTMDRNHTVDVTFWKNGLPPVSNPTAIQSLGTVNLWGYYGCRIGLDSLNIVNSDIVNFCDQNWTLGNIQETVMRFKVVDQNGNGVPSIPVYLWPNAFPDASKYGGYIIINDEMHDINYPAGAPSDSNGIVTVDLSYYAHPDSYNQPNRLPYDAGLWVQCLLGKFAPYNGYTPDLSFFIGKGGLGVTGQTPAMGSLIPNQIIAQIKNTNIQGVGIANCGFKIKML